MRLTRSNLMRDVALFASTQLLNTTAWACTVCHSESGQQVRERIFGEAFWLNVFATLAPFGVLVGVLWAGALFVRLKKRIHFKGTTAMLLGWGLFNLVEGLINHHLLHAHHVVERLGVSVYDYLFLLSGMLFIIFGWVLIRRGEHEEVLHPGLSHRPKHA